MRKSTFWSIVWGLVFIAAAGLIILQLFGLLGELNFWTLIITIPLAAGAIACAVKMSWGGMFLLLAALVFVYRDVIESSLNLENSINIWALLGVAVLLSIGFHMIFGSGKRWKKKDWVNINYHHDDNHSIEDATGERLYFEERFTGASKYIKSDNLSYVGVRNSFGGMEVYFENATLAPEGAEVDVENSFGGVEIYVPHGWNVVSKINSIFGAAEVPETPWVEGAPTVTFRGTNRFGGIEIKKV